MLCMNCKGSGCMHCQRYDAPDLIARGEGPDTLSPEEVSEALTCDEADDFGIDCLTGTGLEQQIK